jgi:general secretion pathway protein I
VLSVAYLNVIGSYRTVSAEQQREEDWKALRLAVLTEPDAKKVETGGSLTLPSGQELTWKAAIEPTTVADLFRLILEAEVPAAGDAEAWSRRQTIYLLRPAWSDPAERDKLREITHQRILQERARSP